MSNDNPYCQCVERKHIGQNFHINGFIILRCMYIKLKKGMNIIMINHIENRLVHYTECSKEERDFIIEELASIDDDGLEVFEEKILFDDTKIKYLKATFNYLEKYPVKKKIENNLILFCFNKNKSESEVKRIKEEKDLFRMRISDDHMLVFTYTNNEIVVKKIYRHFIHRTSVRNELSRIKKKFPEILTTTESINYILENKCSLARYGDGELDLCYGKDISFQKASIELQKRLVEILKHSSNKNILVTIPEFNSKHNNIFNYYGQISFWEHYWLKMYKKLYKLFVKPLYGNTDITRNSVFYENEIEEIKRLWNKREVVFVIGDRGRFEMKEELFDNILSHKTILVPPVNAFDKYQEIIDSCLKQNKDTLFLISCGPTATVLAFDLMKQGYQALDIGHLPNAYDQYLGKIKYPESIPFIKQHDEQQRT